MALSSHSSHFSISPLSSCLLHLSFVRFVSQPAAKVLHCCHPPFFLFLRSRVLEWTDPVSSWNKQIFSFSFIFSFHLFSFGPTLLSFLFPVAPFVFFLFKLCFSLFFKFGFFSFISLFFSVFSFFWFFRLLL